MMQRPPPPHITAAAAPPLWALGSAYIPIGRHKALQLAVKRHMRRSLAIGKLRKGKHPGQQGLQCLTGAIRRTFLAQKTHSHFCSFKEHAVERREQPGDAQGPSEAGAAVRAGAPGSLALPAGRQGGIGTMPRSAVGRQSWCPACWPDRRRLACSTTTIRQSQARGRRPAHLGARRYRSE